MCSQSECNPLVVYDFKLEMDTFPLPYLQHILQHTCCYMSPVRATTPGMETVSQSLGENIEKQLIEYTTCVFSLGKLGVLFGLWSFYFVGGLIGIYMVPPLQMAFFS